MTELNAYEEYQGETDDSVWLTRAIQRGIAESKVVRIPAPESVGQGTAYNCYSPLPYYDHSHIVGYPYMKVKLRFYGCDGFVPGDDSQATTYAEIGGLWLTAQTKAAGTGLNLIRTSRSRFHSLYVENFKDCVVVDGDPHPTTKVAGAMTNKFYDLTTSQQGDYEYRYGVWMKGSATGETGNAHVNSIRDSYIQADLAAGGLMYNAECGVFMEGARGNVLHNVAVSGFDTGVRFNNKESAWRDGYAQLCRTIVEFTENSERCSAIGIAGTSYDIVTDVDDRGTDNRWQVRGSTNLPATV